MALTVWHLIIILWFQIILSYKFQYERRSLGQHPVENDCFRNAAIILTLPFRCNPLILTSSPSRLCSLIHGEDSVLSPLLPSVESCILAVLIASSQASKGRLAYLKTSSKKRGPQEQEWKVAAEWSQVALWPQTAMTQVFPVEHNILSVPSSLRGAVYTSSHCDLPVCLVCSLPECL